MTNQIIGVTAEEWRRCVNFLRPDPRTGCLLWTRSQDGWGYGNVRIRRRLYKVHRLAFVFGGGVLTPERPCVLHNCPGGDNRACCEFTHLWAGTRAENQDDMARKMRGPKGSRQFPFGVHQNHARYAAQVCVNRKTVYLGTYDTPEEASAVALAQRQLLRGW